MSEVKTSYGTGVSRKMVRSRVDQMIAQFYKILPMREDDSTTLPAYLSSLQREMLGMQSLMVEWGEDGEYLGLLGILEYHIQNPDCELAVVRSDVFKALSMIKRLHRKYDEADK